MRARLFWKLGLSYLALLLGIFLAFDFYSSHVLRRDYIRAATDTLESLTNLAEARPPRVDDAAALREWTQWAASGGARVTVIAQSGQVLADSAHDPGTMENHATRPEIQQAFSSGEGESVRHSATIGVDFVYRAVRYQPASGSPVVIRMALPLAQIDASVAELRRRLLGASLLILAIAAAISLISFRMFAARVERLKRFSRRLAEGDFRPLPAERLARRAFRIDRCAERDCGVDGSDDSFTQRRAQPLERDPAKHGRGRGGGRCAGENRLFEPRVFGNPESGCGDDRRAARHRSDPQYRLAGVDPQSVERRRGIADRHRDGLRAAVDLRDYGHTGAGARAGRRGRRFRRAARAGEAVRSGRGAARRHRIAATGARAPGFCRQRLA